MKIHFTREQSEKVRKKLYEIIMNYELKKTLKSQFFFDFERFKKSIAKYDKRFIWLDCEVIGLNIFATYYDCKNKRIGRQWYIYEKIESIKDIEFEKRKTTYEKIKDKIKEKKTTV